MTLVQLLFGYLAVVIVITSVLVVTRRNPVHSVLWMLFLFVHIAALYICLKAEFLAAIQIIIYAGAILVLFLFVLMLLNLRESELEQRYQRHWVVGAGVAAALMLVLVVILRRVEVLPARGPYTVEAIEARGDVLTLGTVLYQEYLFPFEIASLILLVAIIGTVVLAIRRP
jgi:NADH-quinone oxidoreductase subunit J